MIVIGVSSLWIDNVSMNAKWSLGNSTRILVAPSGTIRCFCFYAAVDDKCSIPAINAASQIMTVNSHIVLPRICMKYQNMLIDILAAGECLGRGLSTDCKFTYSSMHARRIQCMRAEFWIICEFTVHARRIQCMRSRLNSAVTTSQLSQHILVFHAYAR